MRGIKKSRSGLEDKVRNILAKNKIAHQYEPKDGKLNYTVPSSNHTYLPDIVIGNTVYELKGYLRTIQERQKYVYIKEQNPHINLVMVFQNPNLPIRKGSKTTYKTWFEKKGIESISFKDFENYVKNKDKVS